MRPRLQDYFDHMRKTGHTCHVHKDAYEQSFLARWIYIKSLFTPGQEFDLTLLENFCGPYCKIYTARSSPSPTGHTAEEADYDNCVLEIQGAIDCPYGPYRPAKYLIFLWLFWEELVADRKTGYEEDTSLGYYGNSDVRRWLRWLARLISHRVSQQILRVLVSKQMEFWLSMNYSERGGINHDEVEYLPWLSSIRQRRRIACVSRRDWEQAHWTIKSATNDEAVKGDADIRALVGALYLYDVAEGPISKFCDVWEFTGVVENFGPFCTFMNLPDVLPTPEMREFLYEFWDAHPGCSEELGDNIIEWYSASMAFIGIPYSAIKLTTECEPCKLFKTTSKFGELFLPDGMKGSVARQELFDAAVGELANLAANEGLTFKSTLMKTTTEGGSIRGSEEASEMVRNEWNNRQGNDVNVCEPPGTTSTAHKCSGACSRNQRSLPKSFMAKEIKAHFIKLLEGLEITLGGPKEKKQLPWTTLPKILMERGLELENWPAKVPLPGSGSTLCDDNKGILGLDMERLSLLYEAVKSESHLLKFRKIAHVSSPSNVPQRRAREDDSEACQRAGKRPCLKGDQHLVS